MPGRQKRKGSLSPPRVDPNKKRKSVMPVEWSDLPHDLVPCIAKRITSLEDFCVFGAVSKSCRSAATKSNYTGDLTHQFPLVLQFLCPRKKFIVFEKPVFNENGEMVMIVPWKVEKRKDDESDPMKELYSLTKDRIHRFNWPQLKKRKVCYSSLGWLLTVSEDLKFDRLVNPFNNSEIQLPHGRSYNPDMGLHFVLSSSPCSTLDYTVMISHGRVFHYCRPGLGQDWKRFTLRERNHISHLHYFKGRYYVVDHVGRVLAVSGINVQNQCVVAPKFPSKLLGPMLYIAKFFLVESAGDLLVVLFLADRKDVKIVGCKVFKVPFSEEAGYSWSESEITNLGNRTLFLCQNSSSFSIEASVSCRCKANCIYFLMNYNKYAGIYNMEDGTIDRDLENSSLQNLGISYGDRERACVWIQPSFNDTIKNV